MLINDGGGLAIKTHKDLMAIWNKIDARQQKALEADQTEAAQAMAAVQPTAMCDHVSDFQAAVSTWVEDYQKSRRKVVKSLRGEFAEHTRVAEQLKRLSAKWQRTSAMTHDVSERLWLHHQVDEWISDAAQSYRGALPRQRNALLELEGVMEKSSQMASQIGLMNAYMYYYAYVNLGQIQVRIPNEGARAVAGQGYETTVGGTKFDQYPFMWRTAQIKPYFDGFKRWVRTQTNPRTADWSAAAGEMSVDAQSTLSMPNNLGQAGQWPEGVEAAAAPPAPTGDFTPPSSTMSPGLVPAIKNKSNAVRY